MSAILHKLCEKSEQELWDLLKEPDWTKEHAEVAYYMTEIMKAVKKIEHLKKVDEAMEEYDWKEKDGEDDDKSDFARGGRGRGRGRYRGGRRRNNYTMFGYDEGDCEEMMPMRMKPEDWIEPPIYYANDGRNNSGDNSSNGNRNTNTNSGNDKNFNVDYAAAQYYETKYRELLEDKWEKEKKEKDKEREPLMTRMPSPPSK